MCSVGSNGSLSLHPRGPPLSTPALALTSGRKVATVAGFSLLAIELAGPVVGGLLGAQPAVVTPASEQLLRRADLESVDEVFARVSEPGLVLLNHQGYYVLVPIFEAERESMVYYPEAGFYRFRWGERDVLVSEEWAFFVLPERLDQPDHLYNFIRAVDRELPELKIAEQRRVLMFFGGWPEVAPFALERAHKLLPPSEPLAKPLARVIGFSAYEVDVARLQDWFDSYIESESANSSP